MASSSEPEFVVLDDAILFARLISRSPRQIVADLYQSRADFDRDNAFERGTVLDYSVVG